MRKKLIAGNWKMNLTADEGRALALALRSQIEPDAPVLLRDREVMVAPPFVAIPAVAQALAGSPIALGAQNVHYEERGAFTGEVSAPMLLPFGVKFVILGHSERRHIFDEDDALIARKVGAALSHGLTPILCVGETAQEHDEGRALEVVLGQLDRGLEGTASAAALDGRMAIAYEPVWAIGTGRNASPEDAEAVHRAIRARLAERLGREAAAITRILYGGSVTPQNVDVLAGRPDIDGVLVGGASLKADSFARIIRARTG
jgi:triosephosphate isomerase